VGSEVGVVTAVTSAITGASFSSSYSPQEKTVRLKKDMRIICKIFFIFSSIPKVKYFCFVY